MFPTKSLFAAICVSASMAIAGPAAAQNQRPPAAVTVVTMQPQTVTLTSTLPGRVQASAEAEVRPQVNGIITERLFREGAEVAEGDALYQIDRATYEAALAQAEAAVTQARVQLDLAGTEAQRVRELQSRNVASQQALDDALSARDAAAAALQVAEAQRRVAEIELERTTIRARLSGEIGLSRTSPGALVTASQADPLAVIRDIDPVHVDVTQSAADLLRWRRGHTAEALGDYCAGPNHVLPTSGTARFSSPLGVYDFQKRSSLIMFSADGASEMGKVASVLARGESLTAHARSAEYRIKP